MGVAFAKVRGTTLLRWLFEKFLALGDHLESLLILLVTALLLLGIGLLGYY
jgi:hypothetical protein